MIQVRKWDKNTSIVVIGTASEGKLNITSIKDGYWRSNVPWPGFAAIELPNGTLWDLSSLANGTQENPWPLDEPIDIIIHYNGLCPPSYPCAACFPIIITTIKR